MSQSKTGPFTVWHQFDKQTLLMAEKEQKLEIYQGLLSCLFGEDEVRQCSFDQKRKIQG